jgi:hypothetical protein
MAACSAGKESFFVGQLVRITPQGQAALLGWHGHAAPIPFYGGQFLESFSIKPNSGQHAKRAHFQAHAFQGWP